jgi:hypothetical protein
MAKLPRVSWPLAAGVVVAFGTVASLASASGSVNAVQDLLGAAVMSDQSGNAVVHPRLLIQRQDTTAGAPSTYCEYADGANNNAGLDQIPRVPTLTDAVPAMRTPLDMGIGGRWTVAAARRFLRTG